MFSDTTLNRIYDRGSSVYNYSLGGEGFTIEKIFNTLRVIC